MQTEDWKVCKNTDLGSDFKIYISVYPLCLKQSYCMKGYHKILKFKVIKNCVKLLPVISSISFIIFVLIFWSSVYSFPDDIIVIAVPCEPNLPARPTRWR